jgi:hypothetical protein
MPIPAEGRLKSGGWAPEVLQLHHVMHWQRGLLAGVEASDQDGTDVMVTGISWEGCDLQDAFRDEQTWNRVAGAMKRPEISMDCLLKHCGGISNPIPPVSASRLSAET